VVLLLLEGYCVSGVVLGAGKRWSKKDRLSSTAVCQQANRRTTRVVLTRQQTGAGEPPVLRWGTLVAWAGRRAKASRRLYSGWSLGMGTAAVWSAR